MIVRDLVMMSIGAAVGAVASYFVTKRIVENRCWNDYMTRREEEKRSGGASEGEKATDIGANGPENGENTDKWRPSVSSADLLAERNSAIRICEENEYGVHQKKLDPGANYIIENPYLIDEDTYASSNDYESEELDWYTHGRFATTENGGGKVEELDALVGLHNVLEIERSGEQYGYVRNERLGRDYVIHINTDEPPIFLDND